MSIVDDIREAEARIEKKRLMEEIRWREEEIQYYNDFIEENQWLEEEIQCQDECEEEGFNKNNRDSMFFCPKCKEVMTSTRTGQMKCRSCGYSENIKNSDSLKVVLERKEKEVQIEEPQYLDKKWKCPYCGFRQLECQGRHRIPSYDTESLKDAYFIICTNCGRRCFHKPFTSL